MSRSEKKLHKKLQKHKGAIEGFRLKDKDQKYVDGLVHNRKPTDVFFAMLFVAYILALLGIAGYSLATGDPKKLVAHQDGDRRFCGIDDEVKAYPKLETMFKSAVCVEECPEETAHTKMECVRTKYTNCDGSFDIIGTNDVLGMCIPKDPSDVPEKLRANVNEFMAQLKQGNSGKMIEDLSHSWVDIVICLVLAMVYAMGYMQMMSIYPTALAYAAVVFIQLLYIVGGAVCFIKGFQMENKDAKTGMLIGGASFVLVGLFFNIMLCCYWSSFKEAIAIVDATADFFAATKRLTFVSIGSFFVQFLFTLGSIAVFLCIASAGEIKPSDSLLDVTRQGKDFDFDGYQTVFTVALFFGFLWVMIYIKNQVVMTMMCSVSTYYFSSNAEKEGSAEVMKALKWSNYYHAGSVAFGSLVMAIIAFLQAFLENVQSESDNAAARCAQCCLKCIEEIIEYINTIAYANMAVCGDSFCTSAWHGFIINLKHLTKFYFAQTLAVMYVFIGFLFVTFFNVLSHFVISKYLTQTYGDITYHALPTSIIIGFTLITCSLFMGLFDEAVCATLQCMGVDRELHDGVSKFGPPTMHEKLRALYGEDYGKDVSEAETSTSGNQVGRKNSLV